MAARADHAEPWVLLTDLSPVPVGRSGRSPMHVDGLSWAARPTAVAGQDLVVAVVTW
ncbi:hypothetical protein [Chloroflexus sp. MS-G]|uniref:hypothetical protein n=1 Tax=Chloroflexus sp. MS-G TaxID=1521187 RepID=UPI0013624D6E|nr:hypothetical protein [Chloroflexus sp. MS-G]